MKKECCDLKISIQGGRGKGKTTLLNMIGSMLQERGISVECFDDGNVEVSPCRDASIVDRTVRIEVTEGDVVDRPAMVVSVKVQPKDRWERVLEWILREIDSGTLGSIQFGPFIDRYGNPGRGIFMRISDALHHLSMRKEEGQSESLPPLYSDRQLKRELQYAGILVGKSERVIGGRRVLMDVLSVDRIERMDFSVAYPEVEAA